MAWYVFHLLEITEPNLTVTTREINAVLRKVGIVRWPMLEVIDNPNISNILYESFSLFGLSGLFSLTLETYPGHQRLALGRTYGFKIGPPEFAFATELRAKQASSDSAVLASYEDSITAIAQTFRSGIPLQGIAREIVLLQHYLRQMTILKPSIKDYSDNNVTLASLSLDQNMLEWYRLLVRIQERTTDRSHQTMSNPGSQVVTIWDKKYLHCINRLFKVEFNVRAVVNYLGWIIVERLGFLSYLHQFDAHRRTVYGYTDPTDVAETCTELVVQLAPQHSASLVFDAEENRALIDYVHWITQELLESFIFQVEQVDWMDKETKLKARRKIEKTTVIVNSGDERSDDFLASWDDGQDFVNIIVNNIINETSKQMRSLWENTSDSCEECSALSPFSHEIQYIHRRNVIGAYINDELDFEDWHSNQTKEKLDEAMNCFANDLDVLSLQSQLLETDYIKLFQAVVCLSGGLSLAYKTYATFMGKYEEQFVESNMRNLKLTLHQYFFLQFARNLCRKYSDQYKKNFNLDDLEDKLRLIVPMRHSFRMARDFVCKEGGQLNAVPLCSII
ncbi:uncharacterized protein LOC115317410 [Ixodes scapularis]|uniref:uncharacterized protein LOC115317410 n=1 Tax=Ixodes scapularis TaxID=6945 RepID=UPI001A9D6444|nr:uncharacterized protein LOC115317410 [Ixodes scapularis]